MERGSNSCINSISDSTIRVSIASQEACANVIIEENQMSEPKKCENFACSCIPEKGQSFCSAHCEGTKGATGVVCECGIPHAKATQRWFS